MADHTPEARSPEPGCQAVSIEGFVCSEPPNHTGDHIARVPNGLLVKQWAGDKHANHGRGSATDGPNEPDCPCRGTGEEAECANAGCGFCRRSTVPTGYAPSTPPEERRAFLKSLASTPEARSPEQRRLESIRQWVKTGNREPMWFSNDQLAFLLSQLDAQAARVRELEQDAERLDWLNAEHERIDPVAAFVVKAFHDREGHSWANVTAPVRVAIDAARGAARTQEGKP